MILRAGASPFANRRERTAAGVHGLKLFLLSLAMLFGASLLGYLVVRFTPSDEPIVIPPLPRALWLSTAMLVASSVTIQMALRAARGGETSRITRAMVATFAMGLGFLAVQAWCWLQWARPLAAELGETQRMFTLAGFYVLTGLHAAHVIGGLIPMAFVTVNAFRGRYAPDDHAGVLYCAIYWHFLDGVWLILFATLLI